MQLMCTSTYLSSQPQFVNQHGRPPPPPHPRSRPHPICSNQRASSPAASPGCTRPKDNRLCVRILQAPPNDDSNVTCVCAMPVLFITHRFVLNSNAI